MNVETNLTTGKCNLGTPFTYHVIIFDARAAVYRKDIYYISPSPSNIRPWECGNLLFNSIYTLHSNSLRPSIPDIVSPSPPGLKRFCDTHISSRYIINSGEIHFAGKMIQWAKIICLITGGYYSLVFLSYFFSFFIQLKGLYCTELLEGLFPPSGTGIILLL